ncbi:hypothetical protein MU852_10940 [Brevundimonas albigilva]|uniref:hypothetical protein n=1 Tax=Brevundimonas albigilva TaxID=1312364 RepID=UPI00201B8F14|nr:hypothetical protein [Brevundimonas albigilva]UQV17420.1 hypothetical protein MU852_10940 [Brevundimonas albigilva]
MFAKRQSVLAAAAGAPPRPRRKFAARSVGHVLRKPPVIAGLAGVFLLATSALFLTVLGDPRAGAPSARIALKREAAPEAAPPAATTPSRPDRWACIRTWPGPTR